MSITITDKQFRLATYVSLGMMLILMLVASKDFGITGDEFTQNTYGEKVYDYYASGGEDKSALSFKNVYFYGGFFDLLCVTVNKIVPGDEYNVRHFITAIFGFLIIVVAVSLARNYKNWAAALLTAWLLFLSPRFFGESMNNPKDVPFALGMLLGAYCIIRFVKAFPKPSLKDKIWLALSIALAISIRVGGLLLIPFLGVAIILQYWFEWRKQYELGSKEIKRLVINTVIISIAGYLLGLVFWPYALQAPFSNPFTALSEMSQFSTGIRMLFDDTHIMSSDVPWYYIPKWLFISSPLIVLLGIVASPILFTDRSYKKHWIFFLFFVALFPLLYIIYKKSPLYDGWRHLFFIYPPLVVLAALAFISMMERFAQPAAKYAITALIVIGLVLPARWSVANHPNQIVYFNELQGGVDGAYGYYETDYYMNSIKQGMYKLAEMKNLYNIQDTVVIATNCVEPMWNYAANVNPKIKLVYARYGERYDQPWDYALFYSRFVDKSLLQNGYFPPGGTIATIDADNTPLCAILQKDSATINAAKGAAAIKANDFAAAAQYYEKALQADPKNETGYVNYAIAVASMGNIDAGIGIVNQGIKIDPSNIQAYQLLVSLYKAKGDRQGEIQATNMLNAQIMEQQGTAEAQ